MNGSATCDIVIAVCTRVGLPDRLERVLQRERVDHGGEHAHVVGAGAVHAPGRARHAPPDVAATDDDRDLDAELGARLGQLLGDALHDGGVDAEVDGAVGERLTRQLEDDAAVLALWPSSRLMSSDASPRPPSRGRTA